MKSDIARNIFSVNIPKRIEEARSGSGFEVFSDASLLSEEWDSIAADNIFLKKDSLLHLQRVNPCEQRYYINEKEKIIFVSYRLKLNIFTLKRGMDFRLPVTIVGVPCSVSYKGYVCQNQHEGFSSQSGAHSSVQESSIQSNDLCLHKSGTVEKAIRSLKGIKLVLNADDALSFSKGNTLPAYILDIRWKSFEEYLGCMRSHYRYRIKKALLYQTSIKPRIRKRETEKTNENEIHDKNKCYKEADDGCDFSSEMYQLYEEVYENSKDKLEKLDIEFFRTFPSTIIEFYIEKGKKEIPAGFIQIQDNDDKELIFMFAGLNHALNLEYDIYLNMLLYMIRYAIENGYKRIDLGQTTMDTKLKLGAVSSQKYMYITSDSPFLRPIMPLAARFLSYKEKSKELHVFKNDFKIKMI